MTESTTAYVAIDGHELTSLVARDTMKPSGAEMKISDVLTPARDYAMQFYGGRSPKVFQFTLGARTAVERATLKTLMGYVNNASEYCEFYPFTDDLMVRVAGREDGTGKAAAWATFGALRKIVDGYYYTAQCEVRALDNLMFGSASTVFSGADFALPAAPVSKTNAGTADSGLDVMTISGKWNGTYYTTNVDFGFAGKTIRLIDSMLHGDSLRFDRYGHIKHAFATGFSLTYANLKNYLNGNAAVGMAGYVLSGANPKTSLKSLATYHTSLFIMADDATTPSIVTMDTADLTASTTGALVAANLQEHIRALGGAYADVSVTFTDGRYKITSGTTGSTSLIRIYTARNYNGSDLASYLKLDEISGAECYDGQGGGRYQDRLRCAYRWEA